MAAGPEEGSRDRKESKCVCQQYIEIMFFSACPGCCSLTQQYSLSHTHAHAHVSTHHIYTCTQIGTLAYTRTHMSELLKSMVCVFSLCIYISAPSTVPGILLALDNRLLNGIKSN